MYQSSDVFQMGTCGEVPESKQNTSFETAELANEFYSNRTIYIGKTLTNVRSRRSGQVCCNRG
jgi:hypothetical protein